MSETEIELHQSLQRILNLFQNYLSNSGHVGKYSRAAVKPLK